MKDFCDRLVEYTRDNNLKQVDIVRITGFKLVLGLTPIVITRK